MTKLWLAVVLSSPLVAAVAGCSTASRERPLQEQQVPAAVRTAFHRQFPAAHVTRYALEKRGWHALYELETDECGAPQSLTYTAAGELAEMETPLPFERLPAAVQASCKQAWPSAPIKLVELVQSRGKISYEIHLEQNGQNIEAVFDAAGELQDKQRD